MTEPPSLPPQVLERTRSIFRRGAVLILFATVIPVLAGSAVPITIALHALWAGWVAAVGQLLGRGVLTPARAGVVSTCGGLLFLPAVVIASGQTDSPFYLMLLCLPLVIASMAPTDQPSVIVSGVGGLAWILGLEVHQGHSAAHIASWLIFSVVCSSIAVWATELHRRSDRDRLRADADRLAAMKRLAEQDRKEARTGRLALLGQLAATVSHEVNNPLAFVTANVSYLGGLLRASGVADDRLEVLEDTTAGLERIGNTIRMLQIFVQPAGGPATGNITEAVGEGLALAAGRLRRVQVQSSVAEGLPLVAMGHRRLVQLIVNLLLNAGEAVEGSTSPQVAVTVTLATGWVQLVVEDSGRGERRPTPSDFRAGSEPTGLGLALCREHVEEVGGSIALEVRPEGGSRVTVALPASSAGP